MWVSCRRNGRSWAVSYPWSRKGLLAELTDNRRENLADGRRSAGKLWSMSRLGNDSPLCAEMSTGTRVELHSPRCSCSRVHGRWDPCPLAVTVGSIGGEVQRGCVAIVGGSRFEERTWYCRCSGCVGTRVGRCQRTNLSRPRHWGLVCPASAGEGEF